MTMANVSLKSCPNDALKQWAEYHWYYLPDSIADGEYKEWCETMHAILLELQTNNKKVALRFENSD